MHTDYIPNDSLVVQTSGDLSADSVQGQWMGNLIFITGVLHRKVTGFQFSTFSRFSIWYTFYSFHLSRPLWFDHSSRLIVCEEYRSYSLSHHKHPYSPFLTSKYSVCGEMKLKTTGTIIFNFCYLYGKQKDIKIWNEWLQEFPGLNLLSVNVIWICYICFQTFKFRLVWEGFVSCLCICDFVVHYDDETWIYT